MKILLLLFALVRCYNLCLASVEQLRDTKQGNFKERILQRKLNKSVGALEKQYGIKGGVQTSKGIPKYKNYKEIRSSEKDVKFSSYGNKWPRYKITRNNEWKGNNNKDHKWSGHKITRNNEWKGNNDKDPSKEKDSKEWKRSNIKMWDNSKAKGASSFGEKIQGPSMVAQENLKGPSNMIKARVNDDTTSRVDYNGGRSGENKEGVGLNNVPHHDKSKRIWEFEKKARSEFPNLKKMEEDTDDIKKQSADSNNKNEKKRIEQKEATNGRDINMDTLRKELEDEALQKLKDLDKKILELQAADLLAKEKEKRKTDTISNNARTSNKRSNFYVAWMHTAAEYMKNLTSF